MGRTLDVKDREAVAWYVKNFNAQVIAPLPPGASCLLRTSRRAIDAPPWKYFSTDTNRTVALAGTWQISFVDGGPALPAPVQRRTLTSWTTFGDPALESFAGTARYEIRFDLPPGTPAFWLLDLGTVENSARVRVNGRDAGVLVTASFQVSLAGLPLKATDNLLQIDVTNLAANRIRDLDRRKVAWRIFHDINLVNVRYRAFDASPWPVHPSGLLGPVRLVPCRSE